MKYKYKTFESACDTEGELVTFPIVPVSLKHRNRVLNVDCLVDSGASESLFSLDIAMLLGIDLANAARQEYIGIGNVTVHGFKSNIKLKLKGFDTWIVFEAGFVDQNEMPLLGHSGFFENHEITFRAFQKKFEIKSKGLRN